MLAERGITEPFPIQVATLPDSLAGRDILGRGRTGSGKTIAFGLPMVARLAATAKEAPRKASRPRALVLVPTRELANQVSESIAPLATAMGMRVTTVFGGVSQGRQVAALRGGVDILVACPGRLEDLASQREVFLDRVEVTVLDEADHMADIGFLPAVKRLLDKTPAGTQRLLFSATLDNGVDIIVKRYLVEARHALGRLGRGPGRGDGAPRVRRRRQPTSPRSSASSPPAPAAACCSRAPSTRPRSSPGSSPPPACPRSSCTATSRRTRASATSRRSRRGAVQVLVATDIAARGIHVDDIELVVHVDPPAEHKAYLHRSGRTARAGAGGTVVTLMLPEQRGDVRTLARLAGISPTTTTVTPGSEHILALTGPPAPYVTPAPEAPAASRGSSRSSSRGSRSGGSSSAARPAAWSGSRGRGRRA